MLITKPLSSFKCIVENNKRKLKKENVILIEREGCEYKYGYIIEGCGEEYWYNNIEDRNADYQMLTGKNPNPRKKRQSKKESKEKSKSKSKEKS